MNSIAHRKGEFSPRRTRESTEEKIFSLPAVPHFVLFVFFVVKTSLKTFARLLVVEQPLTTEGKTTKDTKSTKGQLPHLSLPFPPLRALRVLRGESS
jgi:hypothetical protein